MPKIQPAEQRARHPIPPGDYTLMLDEVKLIEQPNRFAEKDDKGIYKATGTTEPPIRPQLVWQFIADKNDPEGDPLEYSMWTGVSYGNERAKLTDLLDQLLPEADEEMKSNLETDTLVGRRFKTKIMLVKNASGEPRPRAMFFEPVKELPI